MQLYATKVTIEAEDRDSTNVYLEGFDPSQVLSSLSQEDIITYVMNQLHGEYIEAVAEASE